MSVIQTTSGGEHYAEALHLRSRKFCRTLEVKLAHSAFVSVSLFSSKGDLLAHAAQTDLKRPQMRMELSPSASYLWVQSASFRLEDDEIEPLQAFIKRHGLDGSRRTVGRMSAPHLYGPCKPHGAMVYSTAEVLIASCLRSPETGDGTANAALIAEAFTVADEAGLTPRQLLEQRDELLAALREAHSKLQELSTGGWAHYRQACEMSRAAIAKAEGLS